MIQYLGDYKEDDTIYIVFNTFTSDNPSASCTISDFTNTDVHIHKDDGLAQRNNAAGITVSIDFDGITGSHLIKIDTNDNTVSGFWVTGHDYFVRIEGTTIDAATINAFVGHFSIENRFMRGTDSAALATALTTHDTKLDSVIVDVTAIDVLTEAGGSGDLTSIKTQVDAILSLERESGTPTVTGAETTLYEDATPTKNKMGVVVKIDMAALQAGDTFVLKEKYKDESGGVYQEIDSVEYTGAQTKPLRIITLTPYRYGAIITMQKTAGTDRIIEWESFVEE